MAMDDLKPLLQALDRPALAADAGGDGVATNAAFDALLPGAADDPQSRWRRLLGEGGRPHWLAGVAAGQRFAATCGDAAGLLPYCALPSLDVSTGARWLVLLDHAPDRGADAESLRLSLHAAIRAGGIGLWDWDPLTDLSTWSPELYDLYRVPRGTGVEPGRRFLDMVHDADRPRIEAAVRLAAETGGIDPFAFRMRLGDGRLRWIMTSAQVARTADGRFSRLIGVNLDVTDTVEAQAQLEETRRARQRQEQIVQAVMAHAPIGIAVALSGEERLAYVSGFGADMAGLSVEDAVRWEAWETWHRETRAPARHEDLPMFRAMRGSVVRQEEWLLRTADGRLLPISCNAGPIYDARGEVIGAASAWYDVTEFKAAQQDREHFMAAVAHELRTPLSAIQGWAQVMRRQPQPDTLARGLCAITRNVEAQARLVDDLLDVTRMAAGKLAMNLSVEPLAAIAQDALDAVTPAAAAAQVALEARLPAEAADVLADDLRLRQALCNLLNNAVKFSRPGGLVELALEVGARELCLRVIDHGIGLEPEALERIFDQFWQGHQRAGSRMDGLGLGLHIARHIVRGHGGELTAHSEGPGLGTSFSVCLPVARARRVP